MDPDCTDAQAGLDPCWSQTHFVSFVKTKLTCSRPLTEKLVITGKLSRKTRSVDITQRYDPKKSFKTDVKTGKNKHLDTKEYVHQFFVYFDIFVHCDTA
jgi:hypothetical protein